MRFYLRKRSSHSVTLTDSAWTRRMMSPLAGLHEEALHGHEARHRPNCSHAPECRGPRTVGHVVRPAPPGREQVGADVTAYRYAADGLSAFLAGRGMPTRADPNAIAATSHRLRTLPLLPAKAASSRRSPPMVHGRRTETGTESPPESKDRCRVPAGRSLRVLPACATLTAAFQEVPNLFHGSMSDCAGRPAGTEFEVGHSTSLEAQEDPDIRAVRSDVVSCHWEPFGLELHPSPPSDPRCPSRLGILP